jgi:hypothetical protein
MSRREDGRIERIQRKGYNANCQDSTIAPNRTGYLKMMWVVKVIGFVVIVD